ncbi:MAG: HAD hydrolase-like protein [Planctomycetota bacterium]
MLSALPLLFDAVLFDLDGTLVATDRFWVDAARTGAKAAFSELGIQRDMPSAAEWMQLVGMPLAAGFELLFPDLSPEQRARVLARCVEQENHALRAGQATLLPGVVEALTELRERGVKIGLASNCGQSYLDAMLGELGLGRFVHEARCLDTPRMQSKATMIADLLDTFATRAAVFVGDRLSDRDAAWENGLPHVHVTRGFARYGRGGAGEEVAAEGVIDELSELLPRLERRSAWVLDALQRIGAGPSTRAIGITGHSGCGKTLFARDVARVLESRGQRAAVVALDDFFHAPPAAADLSATAFFPIDKPLDHLTRAFDVDELVARVLAPHARGEPVAVQRGSAHIDVPADALLVVQGLFLLHPAVRPHLERVIHLQVSEGLSLRRVAGRDARSQGPESLVRVRRHFLPTQRAFDEAFPAAQHADLVLDAENALGA